MPRDCSRRAVLGALGALGATALAGCTGSSRVPLSSDATPSPGSASASAATSASAAGSAAPSPVRTVKAATGTVDVPAEPSRVVVLDTAELDSALTLGLRPIGAARPALNPGLPGYFPQSWLADIALVGTIGSPDLAAIARLEPDLILSNRTRDGDRFEQLTAIAPTVLTESTGAAWKQNFQTHAQALNKQTAADVITTAYEEHVRQFVAALGGAGATTKQQISLVRFVQDEDPRAYATDNFPGSLLADVRLGRPPAQNVAAFEVIIPSSAELGDADGSTILYATYGDPARAHTTEVLNSASWKKLSAVKAHRAFQVNDQLWYLGIGYFGANLILAQLQRYLGG
ncbi:iron complex transport system substrate-binding protein [Streptacidiphilus sp. MAP12-20]|uniref:ABC transporter substrate-binding protein n=1 Tax=Streptacidiphilus sp. MAP12-20 TaxID=3156299 RepID=UPI0035177C57